MQTVLQAGVVSLILVISGLFIFTIYRFNTYKPQAVLAEPDQDNLEYFQESYEECRKAFLDQVGQLCDLYEDIQVSSIGVKSNKDNDLTIDYCYVPAQKKTKRLFVLTSGLHGIEGYAGSSVQQMFLNEIVGSMNLDELGLLIVHGINPYGFKFNRRVTENNIDLNRNCKADDRLYEIKNEGYTYLNPWLNSTKKVSLTKFDHFFFPFYAVKKIIEHSMASLRQSILQGQYQFEQGIYFGGKELEESIKDLTIIIKKTAEPYEAVFCVDLHTGYGQNGTLHLFQSPIEDQAKKEKVEQIFKGYVIDWGDAKDFYNVTGDFLAYLGHVFQDKYYLPMAFEYGTLDTRKVFGSIKALHNVMIENQGVHYGYATIEDEKETKKRFAEGYYPSSERWRSKVIEDSRKMLRHALKNYGKVDEFTVPVQHAEQELIN